MDVHTECLASLIDVIPFLNLENESDVQGLLIFSSPKASFNIIQASGADLLSLKQGLIHIHCSVKSDIFL
jgi:hypothetical protein